MKTKLGVLAGCLGLWCLAVPVVAHHGFDTEYDAAKKLELTGVVSAVLWTNPHMRVQIDVTAEDGTVTTYNMELTSPNSVRRQGWGRNSLVPGDEVVFQGFAGQAVETRGSLLSIAKVDAPNVPLFTQGGPEAAQSDAPR